MLGSENIVQFGIPRSGSTLVHQIMKAALSSFVLKTHDFVEADKIICTYRDFRDVIVSNWRVFHNPAKGQKATVRQIEESSQYIIQTIGNLNKYRERCPEKCRFLKYEDFKDNFEVIYSTIEEFFQIIISPSERQKISSDFSMEANRKRSQKFKNFMEWDPESGIHGLHIYKGEISTWEEFINPEDYVCLLKLVEEPLLKWGFK